MTDYTILIPVEVHGCDDELRVRVPAQHRHEAIEKLNQALARLVEATEEAPCTPST